AGAKCPLAVGAQHRDANVIVIADARPHRSEFIGHLLVEAVHPLGTVERDRRDMGADVELDGLRCGCLAHSRSSDRWRVRLHSKPSCIRAGHPLPYCPCSETDMSYTTR